MEKDTNISQALDSKAIAYLAKTLGGDGKTIMLNFVNAIYVSSDTDSHTGDRTHLGDKVGQVNYSNAPTEDVPEVLFKALSEILEDLPVDNRFDTIMRMCMELSLKKYNNKVSRSADWLGISKQRMNKFDKSVCQLRRGVESEAS